MGEAISGLAGLVLNGLWYQRIIIIIIIIIIAATLKSSSV